MIASQELLLRLVVAAVLVSFIGIERARLAWVAGLRTHMLLCVGATLMMIVSTYGFADVLGAEHVILDPSRIAAQVISGVSFLGAGTILFLQREQVVRGLTTAAGLWATASIGLAAGSGLYAAAVLGTALAWVILAVLKPLERRIFARRQRREPRLRLRLGVAEPLAAVESVIARQHLPLRKMVLTRLEDGEDQLDLRFDRAVHADQLAALVESLRRLDGLKVMSFEYPVATPQPPA